MDKSVTILFGFKIWWQREESMEEILKVERFNGTLCSISGIRL